MPVRFISKNTQLITWMLLHQTYDAIYKCDDILFADVGLSPQQYIVLIAIKYIKAPATPTEIAHWTDRDISSITLILNRMEKDGLVTRVENQTDRRIVKIVATEKGKQLFEKASLVGWDMVQEILSGIAENELKTLDNILEKIRQKAFNYSTPSGVIEEVNVKILGDLKKKSTAGKRSKKVKNQK
jgi:DNA-binding MarR family transcriptional regulator